MQSILEKNNSVLSAVKGFYDAVSWVPKGSEKNTRDKEYLGGSISKYTKDLVMTFPMLYDSSLSPSTAGMVCKANERNIVSMLQLLFASMQISASSGKEAIAKVHKNISTTYGLDDVFDVLDDMVQTESSVNIAGIRTIDALREMTDYLKMRQKSYPTNSFKERPLTGYMVLKDYYGNDVIREAKAPNAPIRDEFDRANFILNQKRDQREEERRKEESDRARREEQLAAQPKVMTDQDYRKANELAPTLMIITFNEVDPAGNLIGKSSFAAGVKSRLIGVESSDILDRLAAKKNTALNFTNFIRATTGEISFVKDFLFCINQSKISAKNAAKKGPAAKMWNVLDSRHVKNNKNAINRSGNDASAITTLVVNQETANMLKKEYNYDIENPKTARYIMEEYNLLGLIICDESIEVAKILYHGNDSFEQTPYSFLNRENDSSKAYKDVINLVNQSSRR